MINLKQTIFNSADTETVPENLQQPLQGISITPICAYSHNNIRAKKRMITVHLGEGVETKIRF